jgi:hypothetical protein
MNQAGRKVLLNTVNKKVNSLKSEETRPITEKRIVRNGSVRSVNITPSQQAVL